MTTLIWITGASSGLGAALARTCPFPDAHIIDISRSGGTPGTEHLPADLADPAAWSAVGAHLHAVLGNFDGRRAAFIHCAGTLSPIGFAGEVDSTAYRNQILLDAAAPLVLGHDFLSALRQARSVEEADLVLISSGAAATVYPGWSGYGAAKAAVDQWARIAGEEQAIRQTPCRVWAVAPGVLDTGMQGLIRDSDPENFPMIDKFRSLHRDSGLTDPDAAAATLWSRLQAGVSSGDVTDLRA